MTFNTSPTTRIGYRPGFVAIALTPWRMVADLMTDRQTYAELSRLDDHLLKDIGLSRGSIRTAIREGRNRY
jgi:uncharacterized protein YjiS (DUF1127 family)